MKNTQAAMLLLIIANTQHAVDDIPVGPSKKPYAYSTLSTTPSIPISRLQKLRKALIEAYNIVQPEFVPHIESTYNRYVRKSPILCAKYLINMSVRLIFNPKFGMLKPTEQAKINNALDRLEKHSEDLERHVQHQIDIQTTPSIQITDVELFQ